MQTGLLAGVGAYLALQLVIGMLASRKVSTESDYLLAGRSFGPVVSSFTIFATWFGAETCLGAAGLAYAGGLAGTGSEPFGYALCLVLMALVFAVPLWRKGHATLADLLRERYGTGVERLAILVMIPTSLLWAAAQIRAFGLVLSSLSGVAPAVAITGAAAVVLVYTARGGLWADAVTDVLQGVVLVVGLAVLTAIVFFTDAGAAASEVPSARWSVGDAARSPLELAETFAVPIFGSVMAQELVQRVTAARSPGVARNATLVAAAAYTTVGLMPVALGVVGPTLVPGLEDPEQILLALSTRYLPVALQLVFLGALVSAMLSTVDSALLVSGSLAAHNLAFGGRDVPEDARLRGNRVAVVVCGLVAYVLGLVSEGVHSMVEAASSLGSAGVLVVSAFALFSGFGGPRSAATSLVSGTAVYLLGEHVLELTAPFLASLGAALAGYVTVALAERVPAVAR